MTNIFKTPEKVATRDGLFSFGVKTLEKEGWEVSRIPGGGKASLRRITKGGESYKVAIRTSQDSWIAFPRKTEGEGWVTLDDVDFVVAVSVNDRHNPTIASVHMIPGDEARSRFSRAYEARKAAGRVLHDGRGIWLSLYDRDATSPVLHVGAGMGLDYKAIATLDLTKAALPVGRPEEAGEADEAEANGDVVHQAPASPPANAPLTIPEAKRRLADALGVPESAIKISIEH